MKAGTSSYQHYKDESSKMTNLTQRVTRRHPEMAKE